MRMAVFVVLGGGVATGCELVAPSVKDAVKASAEMNTSETFSDIGYSFKDPARDPYDSFAPFDASQMGSAFYLNIGESYINMSNAGTTGAGAYGSLNLSYGVRSDLTSNTLTSVVPNTAVIKLVATEPIKKGVQSLCDAPVPGTLAGGLSVWAPSLHAGPATPITQAVTVHPSTTKY